MPRGCDELMRKKENQERESVSKLTCRQTRRAYWLTIILPI